MNELTSFLTTLIISIIVMCIASIALLHTSFCITGDVNICVNQLTTLQND